MRKMKKVSEAQILNHSLKKRLKIRFGQPTANKIIKCIKNCIMNGPPDQKLEDCVKVCVAKFLDPQISDEIAVGVGGHIGVG